MTVSRVRLFCLLLDAFRTISRPVFLFTDTNVCKEVLYVFECDITVLCNHSYHRITLCASDSAASTVLAFRQSLAVDPVWAPGL